MNSLVVFGLLAAMVASSTAVLQGSSNKSVSQPIRASVGTFKADLNIIELADRLNAHNFLLALKETNLTDFVRNAHDITVFVPTNDAWNALSKETLDRFRANPQEYQNLVKYHVVQGRFPENLLEDEQPLTTVYENRKARFNIYNHTGMANISTYMGSVLNANRNFSATNGYIHFIDQVVDHIQTEGSTLDLVKSCSELTKLNSLVNAAQSQKVNSLLSATNHTLFAPNNKAFENISTSTFDRILHDPRRAEKIILDHITHFGTYFSNGIVDGEEIPTVDFAKYIAVKKNSVGNIRLNDKAEVISANNSTDTGVVHVIDKVLTPLLELE